MDTSAFEAVIRRVPLFETLPEAEIRHLAETLRRVAFAPPAILFHEAEYGDRFYIVQEGRVEIIKALGTPDERVLGVRGPGEYIGEMSLFNPRGARIASARAQAPSLTLEMTRADFDALLHRQPTLAYEMVRVLSARLAQAHDASITDLRHKNQELTEAYESLKAAQAQLVEKEKLEHELRMAHAVQASLLPRTTPQIPGWGFAARWLPAREVSGDYYDFIPLSAEAGLGIAVADVSGKGMPAALVMAITRNTLRASVLNVAQPAESLNQTNQLLCADTNGSAFVTVFYARLDPQTGEVIYVNAGHDPPWHYAARADTWHELTRTGTALGLLNRRTQTQATTHLEVGDFIFLYTDGLTDAVNPRGERFGTERVFDLLRQQRHAPPAELAAQMEAAVLGFCAGRILFDDITFVILKRL